VADLALVLHAALLVWETTIAGREGHLVANNSVRIEDLSTEALARAVAHAAANCVVSTRVEGNDEITTECDLLAAQA
jgi:hypothetical protein